MPIVILWFTTGAAENSSYETLTPDEWEKTAAPPSILYHGTPEEVDVLKPFNMYDSKESEKFVFGTPLREFAMAYLGDRWTDRDINQSLWGKDDDRIMELSEMKPGAFDKIYGGRKGFLHHVPPDGFEDFKTSNKEMVNRGEVTPIETEIIEDVLEALKKEPRVVLKPYDISDPGLHDILKRRAKAMQVDHAGVNRRDWFVEGLHPEVRDLFLKIEDKVSSLGIRASQETNMKKEAALPPLRHKKWQVGQAPIDASNPDINILAYIVGPSGAGKTTFSKKKYAEKYSILHIDDYENFRTGKPYSINSKKLADDVIKATKPVIIEGMHIEQPFAGLAQNKIIVNPGKEKTLSQRINRGRQLKGLRTTDDTNPEEGKSLWRIWDNEVYPEAKKLITQQTNAKLAKAQAITSREKGKAQIEKTRAQQEVAKTKKIVQAEASKKKAELDAERKKNVAAFDVQTASLEKKAAILRGEGQAQARRLKMQADGALKQKLDAWVKVNQAYAEAFSKARLVPEVVMGGSVGNGKNSTVDIVDLLKAKTARDIALEAGLKK